MRRIVTPGSHPRIFSSSDRRRRKPSSAFQKVNTYQDFTKSGRVETLDRFGWPVDSLSNNLVFDWADTDIATPDTGPALTVVGAPTYGENLYLEDQQRNQLTHTIFSPTSMLRTATALDPPGGQDAVYLFMAKRYSEAAPASYPFSTYVVGQRGVRFYFTGGFLVAFVNGDTNVFMTAPWTVSGWGCAMLVLDRGANMRLYKNVTLADTDVCPAGNLGSANGIGINGYPDNTNKMDLDIFRVMAWFGTGIADIINDDYVKMVVGSILGSPVYGENDSDYACNCVTTDTDTAGKYYVLDGNTPKSGSTNGILLEPEIDNKCYRNINPQATTGWTATGGVFTVENDAVALETTGLRELDVNVFQMANATGIDQYVYGGAVTGNTNPHSLSSFARYVAGAGARIGLRDVSAGTFQNLGAIGDSYARTEIEGQTPTDTDMQYCIMVPDGCTLMFDGPQLEEYLVCTSLIPNYATAAIATRLRTVHSGLALPDDASGLVEALMRSEGWAGNSLQVSDFIAASTSGAKYLYISAAASDQVKIFDGTNTATVAAALSGSFQSIRSTWGDQIIVEVDDVGINETDYDGAMNGAGTLGVGGVDTPTFRVKEIFIMRNG